MLAVSPLEDEEAVTGEGDRDAAVAMQVLIRNPDTH
jgi:hypothetical protein